MPVVEFSGDHGWGYDGRGFVSRHIMFTGAPEDLKKLVDASPRARLGC